MKDKSYIIRQLFLEIDIEAGRRINKTYPHHTQLNLISAELKGVRRKKLLKTEIEDAKGYEDYRDYIDNIRRKALTLKALARKGTVSDLTNIDVTDNKFWPLPQ